MAHGYRTMTRRVLALLSVGAFVAGVGGASARETRSSDGCWSYRTAERRFARSHNEIRVVQGKSRLRLDPELSKVARVHSQAMLEQDLLHHSSTVQLTSRVRGWTILGENVGVGNTPRSLVDAFMASPAHRANILHTNYRYFGVGTQKTADRLWVTVIFEATDNPTTSLRMPSCR